MNRSQLQELSKLRVKEAKVLINNRCFDGAYYLLGYSVECALKACIAKQTKRFDFPRKDLGNKSHVHDLEQLLNVSGLKIKHEEELKNREFNAYWSVVKDWKEVSRYTKGITEKEAKDYYKAVTARKNGVMAWIKKFW